MAGCYSCTHQCKVFFFKEKKKKRQKSLPMELLMQQMIGFEPKFKTEVFN